MSPYLLEFKRHWRALLSASLGLAAGSISNYINNLFSPSLVAEFGWSKSQFALIGLTAMIAALCLPLAGRLIDYVGTRRMALWSVPGLPLVFIGLSLMTGEFYLYFLLSVFQILLVSCIAGIMVYSRLLTGTFNLARGVALGLASCAPALAVALFSPVLSGFIESNGWRAGYVVMAVFTGVCGLAAILVMPQISDSRAALKSTRPAAAGRYLDVLKGRTFQILFVALVLCNLHFTVLTTQLNVVMLERGLDVKTGALVLSIYALAVIAGRVICGVALDRFPTHLVAAASFAIPATGLLILASGLPSPWLIGLGIASLGLAMGAEGDLVVYLAAKYFPAGVFSSVLGLFTSAMAISATVGAVILSAMLNHFQNYSPFLGLAAGAMFLGTLLFLLTPKAAVKETVEGLAPLQEARAKVGQ